MDRFQHIIEGELYENPLTDDPNDFVARVKSNRSLRLADICKSAAERNKDATMSAAAMESAVNTVFDEMIYRLCDGFSINTGLFIAAPHIRGVFHSPDEQFDPTKHRFLFELQQGADLRKEIESVDVQIRGMAAGKAHIAQVFDVGSQTTNDQLTRGNNLRVNGREIKLAGEHTDVGIYFVSQDAGSFGTRIKVEPSAIVVNNPSELIFINPWFNEMTYHLEVVTQFSGTARLLNEPRSIVLERLLTVVP
jgi:hypothetical protein